jgi:hypothetical protein
MRLAAVKRFEQGASPEQRMRFAQELIERLDALGVQPGEEFIVANQDVTDDLPKPGRCQFCGERINVNTDYRKVEGYAKPRNEGGTNALALRKVFPDHWAHASCVEKAKRGIAPGQASLVT